MTNIIPDAVKEAFDMRYNAAPVKHERKRFTEFKKSEVVRNGDIDDDTAAKLYYAATGQDAYYFETNCYNKSDVDIFEQFLIRLFNNLDNTPRTLSELLGGSYTINDDGYIKASYYIHYHVSGLPWYDESCYISNFRRFVKKLRKDGYIKATPIKNCGKTVIYLYSV